MFEEPTSSIACTDRLAPGHGASPDPRSAPPPHARCPPRAARRRHHPERRIAAATNTPRPPKLVRPTPSCSQGRARPRNAEYCRAPCAIAGSSTSHGNGRPLRHHLQPLAETRHHAAGRHGPRTPGPPPVPAEIRRPSPNGSREESPRRRRQPHELRPAASSGGGAGLGAIGWRRARVREAPPSRPRRERRGDYIRSKMSESTL